MADNQTWEQPVGLRPGHNGTNMKVDFLLYKDGNTTSPYRECYLRVNVTGGEPPYFSSLAIIFAVLNCSCILSFLRGRRALFFTTKARWHGGPQSLFYN
ncbi:MAG TPA: DUF1616 domain-containing protein [Methanocella sp.]|uniref:DUF1616 domain-containing protein n=1 Tax=Methanocella sp. TaxID=2052833 RepID=UPI002CE27224|nr:DUF1616 domain-containing protein [Methanocella sp.]HTY92106.1 DUF1616 domain-containing protein [Methanocella sp.]